MSDRPGGEDAAEGPDLRKLAQDWITLWQSELAGLAVDREAQETWQVMLTLWAGAAAAMLRAMPRDERASGRGWYPPGYPFRPATQTPTSGTTQAPAGATEAPTSGATSRHPGPARNAPPANRPAQDAPPTNSAAKDVPPTSNPAEDGDPHRPSHAAEGSTGREHSARRTGAAAAAGTAPAAAAPDARDAAIERLTRRLADLETRLAEFERGDRGGDPRRPGSRGSPMGGPEPGQRPSRQRVPGRGANTRVPGGGPGGDAAPGRGPD